MQESPAESGDVLITSWQPFIVIDDDDDANDDDGNDDYVRERPLIGCGDLLMFWRKLGVKPVGTKSQVSPKIPFCRLPLLIARLEIILNISLKVLKRVPGKSQHPL